MILTIEQLRAGGLRIDRGVQDSVLQRCIDIAVKVQLVEMIGEDEVSELANLANDDARLAGTVTFAGIRTAVAYLAVVELLNSDVSASTFGSVQKDGEHSFNVDPFYQSKRFESTARTIVRQYCKSYHVAFHDLSTRHIEML